jgi:hypothetical protein
MDVHPQLWLTSNYSPLKSLLRMTSIQLLVGSLRASSRVWRFSLIIRFGIVSFTGLQDVFMSGQEIRLKPHESVAHRSVDISGGRKEVVQNPGDEPKGCHNSRQTTQYRWVDPPRVSIAFCECGKHKLTPFSVCCFLARSTATGPQNPCH